MLDSTHIGRDDPLVHAFETALRYPDSEMHSRSSIDVSLQRLLRIHEQSIDKYKDECMTDTVYAFMTHRTSEEAAVAAKLQAQEKLRLAEEEIQRLRYAISRGASPQSSSSTSMFETDKNKHRINRAARKTIPALLSPLRRSRRVRVIESSSDDSTNISTVNGGFLQGVCQ